MHDLSLESVKSVLCLGAHSDDIELGVGGTLLTLLSKRCDVHVRWVVFSASPAREAETRASAKDLIGAAAGVRVDVHAFTDGFFPAEWAEIKRVFETFKYDLRPDVVFTHHREDRHQDHRTIAELTWNTFRDALVLEYEIPKFDGELGQPNVFVAIDDEARRRKADVVLEHHVSQREKPWFSRETIDGLMRLRGVECRSATGYAEAFHGRKLAVAF